MNREFAAAHPLTPAQPAAVRQIAAVLLGSLLVALCAHLSIPLWFTPVPLTLQPFAVLLIGLVLAPATAAAAMALYLVEGAAGLPVFAPGGAVGLLHMFGPTAGYLLSYPCAAAMVSMLRRRLGSGFTPALAAAGMGAVVILASGAAWFGLWSHQPVSTVFALAVAPFLPGEALKVAAAASIAAGVRRFRRA